MFDQSPRSWKQFRKVVQRRGCGLLERLGDYPDSILVAGCQRSGTSVTTRVLLETGDMVDYRSGTSAELDGALILSGLAEHSPRGRYVFQTTYVDDAIHEYLTLGGTHRVVWMVRRPDSVVFSMLYNWRRRALNHLFSSCGAHLLNDGEFNLVRRYGVWTIAPLRRACMSYIGKTSQALILHRHLGDDRLIVVDYDDLVTNPKTLRRIFDFCGLAYKRGSRRRLHNHSLRKRERLSDSASGLVRDLCQPTYERVYRLTR
jgi:hypothetical protein